MEKILCVCVHVFFTFYFFIVVHSGAISLLTLSTSAIKIVTTEIFKDWCAFQRLFFTNFVKSIYMTPWAIWSSVRSLAWQGKAILILQSFFPGLLTPFLKVRTRVFPSTTLDSLHLQTSRNHFSNKLVLTPEFPAMTLKL